MISLFQGPSRNIKLGLLIVFVLSACALIWYNTGGRAIHGYIGYPDGMFYPGDSLSGGLAMPATESNIAGHYIDTGLINGILIGLPLLCLAGYFIRRWKAKSPGLFVLRIIVALALAVPALIITVIDQLGMSPQLGMWPAALVLCVAAVAYVFDRGRTRLLTFAVWAALLAMVVLVVLLVNGVGPTSGCHGPQACPTPDYSAPSDIKTWLLAVIASVVPIGLAGLLLLGTIISVRRRLTH